MQEEWRQREAAARMTYMQRHTQILSEHAGERLEWPCSKDELKRVYRRAALRTHPDTGGNAAAFRAAHASYEALMEVAR